MDDDQCLRQMECLAGIAPQEPKADIGHERLRGIGLLSVLAASGTVLPATRSYQWGYSLRFCLRI